MRELESVLDAPPFSTVAETFLEEDSLKELPELIRSLCQVYVARALEVQPGADKLKASMRLLQLAMAIESQLFTSFGTKGPRSSQFLDAYNVLSRIFEYGGRILDQEDGDSTELWMRASVAFALAGQSANSTVAARHCLEKIGTREHYSDKIHESVLRFLAGDLRFVCAVGEKVTQQLRTDSFGDESDSTIQERLRATGSLELVDTLREVATFLIQGEPREFGGWKNRLERAEKLLHESGDPLLEWTARRLGRICGEYIDRSLWSLREYLPTEYILSKTNSKGDEVFTLWPSQTEAVHSLLRSNSRRHQSVVMPTSSGKTLVAEIAMVKELYGSEASAFYVAPTRALVNEITDQLRNHLPPIGIGVTKLPGDYERVPGLERVLGGSARVYSVTPEKLDLLWRVDDSRLAKAKVFVFDETQLIRETGRGLRFELLISKIKASYGKKARIILLSAVIPPSNIEEFVRWLDKDDTQSLDIAWKPTRNLEAFFYRARLYGWKGNVHYLEKFEIDNVLPPKEKPQARENTVLLAWKYQKYLGPVLVYCPTRNEAEATAQSLLELAQRTEKPSSALQSAVSRISAVLGKDFPLAKMIPHGIAYHHGSLPEPVRSIIENLAREGNLRLIVCTSTLAEGVNLNVRTVIVSSARTGGEEMDGARLRNLAGRAGRALKDTEGHVILMYPQLEMMLRNRESAKILSRFFRYIEEKHETPGFNKDVDVVEAELLARVYKGHIANKNLQGQIENLMRGTLFSRQARWSEFVSAKKRVEDQARAIFSNTTLDAQQLEVFATTGLSLDFCQQLDAAAQKVASVRNLSFRTRGIINRSLVQEICLGCLLETDHLEERMKKRVVDPGGIVMGWLAGESIQRLAERVEKRPSKETLTMVSNYVYGYIAEDVSWACSAFVKLLVAHVSKNGRLDAFDPEWNFLPTYLRHGVSSPVGLLLLTAGFSDRDQAAKLGTGVVTTRDNEEDWLRNISQVLSLPPSDESMKEAQDRIIDGLGPFTLSTNLAIQPGSIIIDDHGSILDKRKIVGRVQEELIPLFKALKKRGFSAEARTTSKGQIFIEIVPYSVGANATQHTVD